MTKLTINRKPKGIYGTPQKKTQEAEQPDKTTPAQKQSREQKTQQKTAAKRKSEKSRKKNIRRVERLAALWPELFSQESPRPLKVGIFDDLMEDITARGISLGQGALRATQAYYVSSVRYYRSLMAGGVRYDLKGHPCGEVTQEHQLNAGKRLDEMKKKQQERRNMKAENKHNGKPPAGHNIILKNASSSGVRKA
ncbi:ProQ/FinO family protein [Escherichia coli]|nr:ProQ/FinO family protein [Escherichia coli]